MVTIPLSPLCENVTWNYLNRGDHPQECTAFVTPYYSEQPRICYKHRKWIVDGTDLATFRRDHTVAGGQLVIEPSVRWERERGGHLSCCCCNTIKHCHKLQVIPTDISSLWWLHLKKVDLYTPWMRRLPFSVTAEEEKVQNVSGAGDEFIWGQRWAKGRTKSSNTSEFFSIEFGQRAFHMHVHYKVK